MIDMLNDYYKLVSVESGKQVNIYHVRLNPDCKIYEGHFPGSPVSPGVCNIQMIKECAEDLTGERLVISNIINCRMLEVIRPETHQELDVPLSVSFTDGQYLIVAELRCQGRTCLKIKAEMNEEISEE